MKVQISNVQDNCSIICTYLYPEWTRDIPGIFPITEGMLVYQLYMDVAKQLSE